MCRPLRFLTLLFLSSSLDAQTITVTTTADEFDTPSGSEVSLREAIRDVADYVNPTTTAPTTIDFASALGDRFCITLALGEINIGAKIIELVPPPGRLTIDAGGNSRIFTIGDADSSFSIV
ncbi:MAG: hypothetical protein AAGA58_00940 [Verrucomicrobiota bacterium]